MDSNHINSNLTQPQLDETNRTISDLSNKISKEKEWLLEPSSPLSRMTTRAETAENALASSVSALEGLKLLLKTNQETIRLGEAAIAELQSDAAEDDKEHQKNKRVIEKLQEITRKNAESILAVAVAMNALTELAFNDSLTGLPNRRLLSDRISRAFVENKRYNSYSAALFFDLDKFKKLNDEYGHQTGDKLLIEVANRIKACVRESDTVARYGGDEFVVILNSLDWDIKYSRQQAQEIAHKILRHLSQPHRLLYTENGIEKVLEYQNHASIGIAMFSADTSIEHQILDRADEAMYWAKNEGGNTVRLYDTIDSVEKTLASLYALATKHDIETANHGLRARQYVAALAKRALQMNVYPDQLNDSIIDKIVRTTQLHDIGKTKLPYQLINKQSKLTFGEWSLMKTHTTMGAELILQAKKQNSELKEFLNIAVDIALAHHENWDGTGYPYALAGEAIPISGRIMAIADVYDALICNRPYKTAWTHSAACLEIIAGSGTRFDPLLIEAFQLESENFRLIAESAQD